MTREEILQIPKLGFGLMRLPTLENGKIDLEATNRLVDRFLEAGYRYFDSAYVYAGGDSERAIKECLVKRHPRESFYIATKLPSWNLRGKEDVERIFNEELERTGAGYFDFYLLHNLTSEDIGAFLEGDAFNFVKEKKAQGLIRNIGFSCHDGPEFINKILPEHPELDFVQLQINYADWEAANVRSRECYEAVVANGRPVIVMEPVKGGTLASLRPELEAVFKEADPEASIASWAMRFVRSLPGVAVILSGMNTMEQVEDNIATFDAMKPLSEADYAVIEKVRELMAQAKTVPCTACKYCVDGCPMSIDIPGVFQMLNTAKTYGFTERLRSEYEQRVSNRAAECISCGQCEGICPQHLSCIEYLAEAAELFGS